MSQTNLGTHLATLCVLFKLSNESEHEEAVKYNSRDQRVQHWDKRKTKIKMDQRTEERYEKVSYKGLEKNRKWPNKKQMNWTSGKNLKYKVPSWNH